jgi:hypothetical protein
MDQTSVISPAYDAGPYELWNARDLPRFKEDIDDVLRLHCPDPASDGEWCRVWRNKTPFMEVGNGDYIAFDVSQGDEHCPVIYLDHEGDEFGGSRLGLNFIDFITRWSNLGCPNPISLFRAHDAHQNLLMDSGEVFENCKRWLND